MLKQPTRTNPTSLIKLLVYAIAFALTLWIALLLISANLWNLKVGFGLRYLIPTLEFKELYSKLIPALQFAAIGFFVITTIAALWSTWQARSKLTEFGLERKYAINFVALFTQAVLLINFYGLQTLNYILLIIFVMNAGVFLYSMKSEKISQITTKAS